MTRADLLALTPEALASFANVGLLKRATKEVERGEGPQVELEADGTLVGRFSDGVEVRVGPGQTLKQAACTCTAPSCRHRVATVLAYQRSTPVEAVQEAPWSPGEITDAQLEATLPKETLEAARREREAGVLATVVPGVTPSVSLPNATVRFLVPRDPSWARCDCKQQQACVHVALAVWAARMAPSGVVSLGGAAVRLEVSELETLLQSLVGPGLEAATSLQAMFAVLREAMRREGHVWLETLLEDLEQALEGWRNHSARFSTASVRELVVELWARIRAATSGTGLPVSYVVGDDAPRESMLDHVRLLSLGCRLERDGSATFVDVFTVDPDTQEVLILRRRLDDVTEVGAELARRTIAPKVQLGTLAKGQLISKVVTRHANRLATLSNSRAVMTSVSAQNGDWSMIRPPLRVTDVKQWLVEHRAETPRLLRPRVVAEALRVVEVAKVLEVVFVPSEQTLVAMLEDLAGTPFEAVVRHRSVAPHALQAAARAFSRAVRFVSGELMVGENGPLLEVLAISGDGLVEVPDLGSPGPAPSLPEVVPRRVPSAHEAVLRSTASLLDELLVKGLRRPLEMEAHVRSLEEHGFSELSRRIDLLHSKSPLETRVTAWVEAATLLWLLGEQLS